MKILGIETSCDETAASVVENGDFLLSNVVASSMDLHSAYGGVVPEIAARSQIEFINPVIKNALDQAGCSWKDIDAIAVTKGPGLGGSLLVGVLVARTLAIIKNKPLYAIDHVKAHVFASFITGSRLDNYTFPSQQPTFPLLALIVSGGHTQLVFFKSFNDYKLLGATTDDAVGEAFDKVAKIIGLPYPGGPSISRSALNGDKKAYTFPKAKMVNKYDFSFSGLKTAVLRKAQAEIGEDFNFSSFLIAERLTEAQRNNFAASFEFIAVETLVDKLVLAAQEFTPKSIVVAGGVAANKELRSQIKQKNLPNTYFADHKLCTDNGAMIAVAGFFSSYSQKEPSNPYSLEINPSLSM